MAPLTAATWWGRERTEGVVTDRLAHRGLAVCSRGCAIWATTIATEQAQEVAEGIGLRTILRQAAQVHAVSATSGERDEATAAGCRRSKQTQQHSSSALAGLGGVRPSPSQGGAGGETELTDSGEVGARNPRSGVSDRDARDIASLMDLRRGNGARQPGPMPRHSLRLQRAGH